MTSFRFIIAALLAVLPITVILTFIFSLLGCNYGPDLGCGSANGTPIANVPQWLDTLGFFIHLAVWYGIVFFVIGLILFFGEVISAARKKS
jgi:hypothetical protein